jgi:Domain of unknown function (DUF4232)
VRTSHTKLYALAMSVAAFATVWPLASSGAAARAVTVKGCVSSQITLAPGARQGTAGTTYIALVFTNHGSRCAIWGVPSIQPVAGTSRAPVGAPARNTSMGEMPARHVLYQGHSVSVAFGVVDTGNYPPTTCVARRAAGVVVSLGTFVRPTYVPLSIKVCTRRVSTTTRLIAPGASG